MSISLDVLHELCEKGHIKWTAHILARLQQRGINPSDIKNCIMTGEIIEDYPTDYPYPSCLIFGFTVEHKILHTVVGLGNDYIWLITAYYPNDEKWETDYKTRKVDAI